MNSTKTTGIPDRIWTVTEAVQAILLIQTNGLISQGVPEQLTNVVGNLWFRFLAKIGTINVPKVEPVVLTDIYKISIFDNLAILYLSLLSIHYPVLCCDILSWIGDGTLCYFNTTRLLPEYFKPKKLLGSSLRVRSLPTLKSLKERVLVVSDILDDVPKPKLHFSVLEALFNRLRNKFEISANDVHLLCVGLFKMFYKAENQTMVNVELIIAACFVTSLRLFFQFENPDSSKEPWLIWFLPYLKSRHKNSVGNLVDKSIVERHGFVTEKHFLNMPLEDYLKSVEAIISQNVKVLKDSELTSELKQQFSSVLEVKSENHTVLNQEQHENGCLKNSGKRKYKKKSDGLHYDRKMVVYPIDELLEDSILPLELQIIVDDIAGHFHITSSELFAEMQRLAGFFDSK